jgi:hypothetical protein
MNLLSLLRIEDVLKIDGHVDFLVGLSIRGSFARSGLRCFSRTTERVAGSRRKCIALRSGRGLKWSLSAGSV